ncbi:DUF2510 domain-containing protein [Microcella indica]|uniref:DUF2510 domain-containing protein n=1 Tax=Microcella indica TaxID=2750620 RepID=UPI0015CF0973|nr:DUF2510 domain-containing protein [Microcella indica]
MTEGSTLPVAGWYDDPEIALRLRWWDGARWTQHTRPKPIAHGEPASPGAAVAQGGTATEAASATTTTDLSGAAVAAPVGEEPYSYSVPYSATPTSAPSTTTEGGEARSTPLGTFGTRSVTRSDLWNTTAQSMDYTPERTTTVSAWMLAATPLVAFLAQLAVTVLTGIESTPWFWVLAASLLPIMWIIVWVRRDREKLHEWGHLERASGWWALLGNVGYLAARGIVVQRQAGRGWWPLIVTLLLTAGLVSLGIFTPALFLVFMTPIQ